MALFLHLAESMTRTNPRPGHVLGGGIVAGIVGGAVIALVMLLATLVKQQDIWPGLKGAAAPFLGERALQPGFDPGAVALGVACHFAVSIVWGILFAALFSGLSRGATIVAGAIWGLIAWFGMSYVVLPLAGLEQMARQAPAGTAILSHLMFGLAVGIGFLPFQRTRPPFAGPLTRLPAPPTPH
jgi:hypothetical protein